MRPGGTEMGNGDGFSAVLPKNTTSSFLPGLSSVRMGLKDWGGKMLPQIPPAAGLVPFELGENHALLLHLQIQHPKITDPGQELCTLISAAPCDALRYAITEVSLEADPPGIC